MGSNGVKVNFSNLLNTLNMTSEGQNKLAAISSNRGKSTTKLNILQSYDA